MSITAKKKKTNKKKSGSKGTFITKLEFEIRSLGLLGKFIGKGKKENLGRRDQSQPAVTEPAPANPGDKQIRVGQLEYRLNLVGHREEENREELKGTGGERIA